MTPLTTEQRAARRRRATGASVTIGGLAILGIAAAVAWSWRPELPDPVASHWGVDGVPDGFSSLGGLLAAILGLGAVIVLAFGSITWALGQAAATRRIGAAATVWVALFIAIVVVGTLSVQRGLDDARAAGDVSGVLLVAVVGSLVPALIVASVVPADLPQPATGAVDLDAPRLRLAPGDPATWVGRASSPTALAIGLPVAALLLALVVLTRLWALLIIDLVVIGLLVAMSWFVVRVDRTGLTVRSSVGWPRTRVPLDELVRADVTQVSPVREFGGWGWRVGRNGRIGIVMRRGEALLVERTGGRSIVVTADDAATAAGLLNTLADDARRTA
jgi:hypothetical protein